MNVDELYSLTQWANKEVIKNQLANKYQDLHNRLLQNNHQFGVGHEKEKNELIETLEGIDFTILTKDQVDFLDELQILSEIGFHSISQIKDILFLNNVDVGIAEQKLKKAVQNLSGGITRISSIYKGLNGCVHDEIGGYQEDVFVRIGFHGDAVISNVEDFKDWGEKWHHIGRGIALAHNKTPQDVKIVGATRGSVMLEVVSIPEILATIAAIVLFSQKAKMNYLNMKKVAADTRLINAKTKHLDLQNKVLEESAKNLDKEAKAQHEVGIKNALETLKKELNLTDSVDNEKSVALEMAITYLFDFNKQGGAVNFITPKQEYLDEADEFKKVREIANDIRNSTNELKRLKRQISESNQISDGNQKRIE